MIDISDIFVCENCGVLYDKSNRKCFKELDEQYDTYFEYTCPVCKHREKVYKE
jgi:transcription elongation factor Elf1